MIIDIYNPGEKIENEFLKEKIRSKINEMLNWKRKGFPGSNPVSLTNHNIKNLFNKEYIICEKTDGVRYFLFIASNTTFLIDRNYEIFKNDMHIPLKEDLSKKQQLTLLDGELVEDTIFHERKGIEEKKIVYLIYDGLYIQRRDITNLSYLDRLKYVYNYVITPLKIYKKKILKNKNFNYSQESVCNDVSLKKRKYNVGSEYVEESKCLSVNVDNSRNSPNTSDKKISNYNETDCIDYKRDSCINIDNEINYSDSDINDDISSSDSFINDENEYPFEIYLKDFYTIDKICELTKIMKKLPHPSDGIIFTPLNSSYVTGNFYHLLKWKPLNLNTVDFGIETVYDENNMPNKFELFIAINGVRTSYKCYLAQYGDVYKELLQLALNNKISHYIVECYYVSKNIYSICKNDNSTETEIEGGWIAQKIRYDKNIPNDISTLNKVIQSILDNITIDSLIKEILRNKKC
ncbi:RNA guanylyltransferase, putative [Plasmodium gallinaceum]|uniref:mRNA guanylyltransferase n=1 Tax=Plasmodium gallinaceum TaxID=5849 RepID=A0A1J1GTP2_PLAGA|nr:RNA guanylyltransferase, putative [Plasmodium gallinaceum]CRG95665.1 RNA guanylyltransferase, putative [Plasmodium gallinaceum]